MIYGGKDVENRRWRPAYRGPLLIHAGKDFDPGAVEPLVWTMADAGALRHPRTAWEARGAIIGLVFLADVLSDSASRWARPGWYHWVLEFAAAVDPPFSCRGQRGLWTPPAEAANKTVDLV